MNKEKKIKLMDLDPEILAEALLDLAAHSEAADDLIERLISTSKENIQRFKKKLTSLKRSRRFIDWREVFEYSQELSMLLQDLKAGVTDPLTGVELVAAFYEADEGIIGHCDDSDGCVGDIFRVEAKELFVEYASHCTDKEIIAEIILKLNRKDDYGLRSTLIACAGEYLPEPVIRLMISELQKWAEDEKDEYNRNHYLMLTGLLARQIKDAELFEKTRIASRGKPSTAAIIDIAQVYLESGNVETAHSWIKKIPTGETFMSREREQLLLEIYKKQGDTEKLTELLSRKFRGYPSAGTLQELLNVIGNDRRDQVIADEAARILGNTTLRASDAEFLISTGRIDEAEEYLINRAEQLNGNSYGTLLPLAEAMELENRNLAASLIYRSLLVSILERGYIKAYPHGVRYLKKLNKLAAAVSEWKNFDNHEAFKSRIYQDHKWKTSFWSKAGIK